MNVEQIKNLINNGLIITRHTREKMVKENISEQDIKEALTSGKDSTVDHSKRNDKSFAWNNSRHETLIANGLTIVFVDSLEHACLVVSVYHGTPHNYFSNPYNSGTAHTYSLDRSNQRLKIFR